MKEMSNKELLMNFGSITYVSGLNDTRDDTSDMYEKELLDRLALGKQAIEIVDELYTWNLENFPHLKDMVIEFMKKREGIK